MTFMIWDILTVTVAIAEKKREFIVFLSSLTARLLKADSPKGRQRCGPAAPTACTFAQIVENAGVLVGDARQAYYR